MPFVVIDCIRCGAARIQHMIVGASHIDRSWWEVAAACNSCHQLATYMVECRDGSAPTERKGSLQGQQYVTFDESPVRIATTAIGISDDIPVRIANLFREANECRQMTWYEAAGAMFRKTLDVATKHIYANDPRLAEKNPATNLRPRIKAMGALGILEPDIVELADVAALDGNDATHDVDPYTADEAEALEYLTQDLMDRLFVRPARLASVRAKQVASGQRKAPEAVPAGE